MLRQLQRSPSVSDWRCIRRPRFTEQQLGRRQLRAGQRRLRRTGRPRRATAPTRAHRRRHGRRRRRGAEVSGVRFAAAQHEARRPYLHPDAASSPELQQMELRVLALDFVDAVAEQSQASRRRSTPTQRPDPRHLVTRVSIGYDAVLDDQRAYECHVREHRHDQSSFSDDGRLRRTELIVVHLRTSIFRTVVRALPLLMLIGCSNRTHKDFARGNAEFEQLRGGHGHPVRLRPGRDPCEGPVRVRGRQRRVARGVRRHRQRRRRGRHRKGSAS